jgi:hypothetical protein
LLGRYHKTRVYVDDWRAGHLSYRLTVLDADDLPGDISEIEVHAQDDFLAASAAGKFVDLPRIVPHADPNRVRLSTSLALQGIPDDHPKSTKRIE